MRWAHTCTQTHDRLPCWTCLCYCNHFVQSHWKRKNKNRLVSERFFMKSIGSDCYILQRGAQLMFYGMTNAFSLLNVNTNKEKSINTLESFVVLFPEDSSRCFFVGERGGICTIPLAACNLETFKTVQGHRYVFSLKSSKYPYFTLSKKNLIGIQNIHVVTSAHQSVNEFKKGKSK